MESDRLGTPLAHAEFIALALFAQINNQSLQVSSERGEIRTYE